MRASRPLALLASTLLCASGLALVALSAPVQAADHQLESCAPGVPRPCVMSFTRNGTTPPPDLELLGVATEDGVERDVSFSVYKTEGPDSLDLGAAARADTFSVTLDMGSWSPSIVAGKARDAEVVRQKSGSGYLVTVTAKPVLLSGQCDQSEWPWRCPEADVVVKDPAYFNNVQWDAIWSIDIDNAGFISDPERREQLYGLDYFHNFAASALPPSVEFSGPRDTASLVIEVANRRYLDDLTTLVNGHAELRVPDAFLKNGYGIPDPSTMTGSGLAVSGPGSAASVSVTHEKGSVLVLIDGMTFPDAGIADGELRQRPAGKSAKVIRVKRGVVTPTKAGVATTKRLTAGKGSVKAKEAKARGAKITGYQAVCTSGAATVTGKSKTRTVVVTGLKAGRAYQCKVRALSKAGPAGYGSAKQLAARP